MVQSAREIVLRYAVPKWDADWIIPDETVPESKPHDIAIDLLKALLVAFIARTKLDAQVARNMAVRFTAENPRIGTDPDLCIISPSAPEGDELESLCLWQEGHSPPILAIEVVSKSNAEKDYVKAPDKYAAAGVKELWVVDPRLVGKRVNGGPHRIQVWREAADGSFEREYAGPGPAYSPTVNGWLHAVDEGRKIRIADDREATRFWMTGEEAERAAKEAALAAKEAALAANEASLARIAELEAKLASR